jgi:hypothetical protein
MAVNRFSKIREPLTIDPISFEEFMVIPTLEARAEAEVLAANNRISTEADVDQKDLAMTSAAVGHINDMKQSLVDDVANNGITNETITKLYDVKDQRNKVYNQFINQAQANKKAIDAWRKDIDAQVLKGTKQFSSPQYADHVKKMEYTKWKGTMNPDGTLNQFVPSYGAKYYDIDQEIEETMDKAGFLEGETGVSGRQLVFHSGLGQYVEISRGGTMLKSNESNLAAAANKIAKDFLDPTTEQGQYAAYANLSPQMIADKIMGYLDVYRETSKKTFGFDRKYIKPVTGDEEDERMGLRLEGRTGPSTGYYNKGLSLTDRSWTGQVSEKYKKQAFGRTFGGTEGALNNLNIIKNRLADQMGINIKDHNERVKTGQATEKDYELIEKAANKGLLTELSNVIFLGSGDRVLEILDLIDTGPKDIKDQKDVIDYFSGATDYLIDQGKITPDLGKRYQQGDEDAIGWIYDLVVDHVNKQGDPGAKYFSMYQGQTLEQLFGEKTPIVKNKIHNDVLSQFQTIEIKDLKTRTRNYDADERFELANKIKDGTMYATGVLPVNPDAPTDIEGNYNKRLSQGYVFQDIETGDEYIISRVGVEKEKPFQQGADLEEYISGVPYEVRMPVIINDPNYPDKQVANVFRSSGQSELLIELSDKTIIPFDGNAGLLEAPKDYKSIKEQVLGKFKEEYKHLR